MQARATLMPSAEVPDMRPRTSISGKTFWNRRSLDFARDKFPQINTDEEEKKRWKKMNAKHVSVNRGHNEEGKNGSCDLFLELGEEVEGVEGLEVVEVGRAEGVENGAVERGERQVFGGRSGVRAIR